MMPVTQQSQVDLCVWWWVVHGLLQIS